MFINKNLITQEYDVKRVDDKMRYYKVNLNSNIYKLPSVTTILSHVKDSQKIEELRNSMDPAVWSYVTKRGTSRGTVMHKFLELFLLKLHETHNLNTSLLYTQTETKLDCETKPIYENDIKFFNMGRDLFYNFWYDGWFNEVKDIVLLEAPLFSINGKYAGTDDLCYINKNNKLIIGDFKSSNSQKIDDDIKKYKMQVSAYMEAFYEMYKIKPDFGEILISYDNSLEKFIVPFNERHKYLDEFLINANLVFNKFNKITNEDE